MPSQSTESLPGNVLQSIFVMQAALNDYVFVNNNLRDHDGNRLTMDTIATQVYDDHLSVNDLPNQWLARFSRAMKDELNELNDELLWKWWSNDRIDIHNIRTELVDILHFLISAMICAGITADRLYDIYKQKHTVNLARQASGYSQHRKSKNDDRSID